jgi:hypothetical protein
MAGRVLLEDILDAVKGRQEMPRNERLLASLRFATKIANHVATRNPLLSSVAAAMGALVGSPQSDGPVLNVEVQEKLTTLRRRLMRARTGAEGNKLRAQIQALAGLFSGN